jgi:phosphate-selective porin OprO/OprP
VLPLRTSVQSSENDEAAVAASAVFLGWNEGVEGVGDRLQIAAHLAWYHRQWTFEGEWQFGRFGLAPPEQSRPVYFDVEGFSTSVGYMLTGETVKGRTLVEPLRPLDPRRGWAGLGAIELFGRYGQIALSDNVFSEGLVNPDLWSNRAYVTDVGFNWYWNRLLKWTFAWQHAEYGSPVLINENTHKFSRTNDLFWFRGQIYF